MEKLCLHDSCFKSAIQGLSNGVFYGAKIRFTHSLVMSILFSSGSVRQRLKKILHSTKDHAKNLGCFVFIFKSIVCLLVKLLKRQSPVIHFFSAAIGTISYIEDSPINTQTAFYLLSRGLMGGVKLLNKKKIINTGKWIEKNSFSITTILCWGSVMTLFEVYPKSLQSSLTNSMEFLYHDSNRWEGWRNCIPYCNQVLSFLKFK